MMRRQFKRLKKPLTRVQDDYEPSNQASYEPSPESSVDPSSDQPQSESLEKELPNTSSKSKNKGRSRSRRMRNQPSKKTSQGPNPPAKKKKKKTNLQLSQQSNQSQILQIKHGDDATKDHIRPAFLKRWDGQSNELELTPLEIEGLTPMFKVYWDVKCHNMNSIVFLEYGKMEFLAFQDDAIKLNQIFKKKIKTYSKFLMVNFWCKEVQNAKKQLFLRKIPVIIMNEIDDPQYRNKYGLVRRQVQEVLTPALHIDMDDPAATSRNLLAIYKQGEAFAMLLLDAQTNHFYLHQAQDDIFMHQVRRVINCYRPVQLVVPDKGHRQIVQMARQICNPHVIQLSLQKNTIESSINLYCQSNISPLFKEMRSKLIEQNPNGQDFSLARSVHVLSLMRKYLSTLSLVQKIFNQGLFHLLKDKNINFVPFFDSQVYQNLQLFRIKNEQQQSYAKPGTLIGYLNSCKTLQGRNLLHKWIDQPLTRQIPILQRQQAVKQMLQGNPNLLAMHDRLLVFQKLQKRLGDIYHWVTRASQKGRLVVTKNINYQKQYDIRKNPAVMKLRQIITVLQLIKDYQTYLRQFRQLGIHSTLLKQIAQLKDIQGIHNMSLDQINKLGGVPQISYVADSIMRRCNFDQLTGNLQPRQGQSQIFDFQKQQIVRLNNQLMQQLNVWKKHFNSQKLSYVSVRAKNQIQIPKSLINKGNTSSQLIFSSQIAGSIRYTTPRSYAISDQLMQHQKYISQSYQPFLQSIVEQFCKFRFLWDIYAQSIATLDVLMSLSKAAKSMGVRCLPQFDQGLTINHGFHVNLFAVREEVIPNTIQLHPQQQVLLLTGPNMGGKSTFLKQTCVLAVLAQIGSYVPAQFYRTKIFDQIFCRMGACDRIYQGQSTFYVQLEQTKRIIQKATPNSLVVIDELGRGTSTFDGMAIAQAVLDHLISSIRGLTLYSTHYTQITQRFSSNPKVKLMKMGYQIQQQNIEFTYQLVEGVAQKSFANNVGRMVKINKDILELARVKSQEMNKETMRKKMLREACRLAGIDSLQRHMVKIKQGRKMEQD